MVSDEIGGTTRPNLINRLINQPQVLRMRAGGLGLQLRGLPDEVLVHSLLPCLDGAALARYVRDGWMGWCVL